MRKNEIVETECTGLGAAMEGICRVEGQVLFVPGALPGEQIRARVIKATKKYAVGRLEALLAPSQERVQPPCPYYPRCGGCTAQHMTYGTTLAYKRQQVADCFARIGGIETEVEPVDGMAEPWRYRNKGAFPVGGEAGAPSIGLFAARSHAIVDVRAGCLLQTTQSDALVDAVRRWMTAHTIPPYNETTHTGLVRHIMTREAADGSVMLVLVINGRALPHQDSLLSMAREAVPSLRTLVLNVNTKRTNVILGDTMETLWGDGVLEDTLCGFAMQVSPRSFFQVNRPQAEVLYGHAVALAGLTGRETVWDVYCGAGSITLPLAQKAAHVTGIEVVEDAVADARRNAQRNGVDNVDFRAGTAETLLPEMVRQGGRPDVIVLDPPRKGCEEQALDAVAQAEPNRIVYVSCNPATLARDVARLCGHGYAVKRVQPVDMFGWTAHVECVVLMSKAAY